jgi:4-amino-4-deoxy-L-arabinose transferase-like glycosyltransferase
MVHKATQPNDETEIVTTVATPRTRPINPWTLAVSCAVVAVLVFFADGYGPFRDELYFSAMSNRIRLAYPDVPPVTPVVARLTSSIFGDSLLALRVWPALCMAGVVLLSARTVRLLGGGRLAENIAMAAVAASPIVSIFGHVFHYAAFDLLAWSAAIYALARVLITNAPRWWIYFGLIVGVAYENKNLISLFVLTVGFALLLVGPLVVLEGGKVWIGAALAIAIAAPNVYWQWRHGWPEATLAKHIGSLASMGDRLLIGPFQFAMAGLPIASVFLLGLRHTWNTKSIRALTVGYLLLIVLLMITGGKQDYAVGLIPFFLSAGACSIESRIQNSNVRRYRLSISIAVSALISLFLGLPITPLSRLADSPVTMAYPDVLESVGWPEFSNHVAAAIALLSPDEQRTVTIFTRNYGEAAALEERPLVLPSNASTTSNDVFKLTSKRALKGRVWSAHNGYWFFGPPPQTDGAVVVVGYDRATLSRLFRDVRIATRVDNEHQLANQEHGQTVWICHGMRTTWKAEWESLRHFD